MGQLKRRRSSNYQKQGPSQETEAGFLFLLAFLLFVFIFTNMKLRTVFMLLTAGLLLTASVGFASDATKTTKDCYQACDMPTLSSYDVCAKNDVVFHTFMYVSVDSEFILARYAEGPVDVGKNVSNEFAILPDLFIMENSSVKAPPINDWLRYKQDLNFGLTYKKSKTPICDCLPYRC